MEIKLQKDTCSSVLSTAWRAIQISCRDTEGEKGEHKIQEAVASAGSGGRAAHGLPGISWVYFLSWLVGYLNLMHIL